MAVYVGSARSDERGKLTGGQAGDQTGKEVSYQTWYLHSKGWYVLRAKDPKVREKIAYAMKAACDNNKIGYDQSNRSGLYNAVKTKGYDPAKCTVATETDCSALVRVCVCYALGKSIADFNTSSLANVLVKTGAFDKIVDNSICKSSANLYNGDILVTRTKGHTVAVISGGKANTVSAPAAKAKVTIATPTLKKGAKGTNVKTLQSNLNAAINAGIAVDGSFGNATFNAVKAFQTKYGLSVDGCFGPKSAAKMNEVLN